MILVVGATGLLGGEICHQLSAAGHSVRALVRPTASESRVESLRVIGAELVTGDLKDRASLDAACADAQVVITTASTTLSRQPDDTIASVDQDGQLQLIDAAKASGVSRFVYISYSGNHAVECPLTTAKRSVEQALRDSSLTYTILRPSYFMEVWLSPALGFDVAKAQARVYGAGRAPISFISFKDVARFAVRCLTNPAARNATIELGGPEALSPLDVVRIFEASTGRTFDLQHVPEEVLEQQHAGARDPLERSFGALMLAYARGDVIDMSQTLDAFPLQLTSVREFADATSVRRVSLGTSRSADIASTSP
jgi:NADH dehydrogenase